MTANKLPSLRERKTMTIVGLGIGAAAFLVILTLAALVRGSI
jgi:hypothetical protein